MKKIDGTVFLIALFGFHLPLVTLGSLVLLPGTHAGAPKCDFSGAQAPEPVFSTVLAG